MLTQLRETQPPVVERGDHEQRPLVADAVEHVADGASEVGATLAGVLVGAARRVHLHVGHGTPLSLRHTRVPLVRARMITHHGVANKS